MADQLALYRAFEGDLKNALERFFPGRNILGECRIHEHLADGVGMLDKKLIEVDGNFVGTSFLKEMYVYLTIPSGTDEVLYNQNRESFLRTIGDLASQRWLSIELDRDLSERLGTAKHPSKFYAYKITRNN